MSAAVCLLASLLSCPNPDTGARLHPVTEQTRSIESEAQAAAPVAARFGRDEAQGTIAARFGRDEGAGTIAARQTVAVIYSHFDESSKSGDAYASLEPSPEQTQSIARESATPIASRFGREEGVAGFDAQSKVPVIFSGADDQRDADDQQPRDKKRKSAQPPAVEKSVRTVQTRTKIILQTTKSPAVETAYTEQSPLEQQWRLSSLFGIRNAANPTLDQPLSSVAGIEMDKPGYQEVVRAAKIHEVPVELALRVAKQESRGNCGAKSSAGALGVMQVMPRTGAKHGYSSRQLSDCRSGAEAGVKELKHLLQLSGGDIKQTLTGYNCGERCMFGRRSNLPMETVNYIKVVTQN